MEAAGASRQPTRPNTRAHTHAHSVLCKHILPITQNYLSLSLSHTLSLSLSVCSCLLRQNDNYGNDGAKRIITTCTPMGGFFASPLLGFAYFSCVVFKPQLTHTRSLARSYSLAAFVAKLFIFAKSIERRQPELGASCLWFSCCCCCLLMRPTAPPPPPFSHATNTLTSPSVYCVLFCAELWVTFRMANY